MGSIESGGCWSLLVFIGITILFMIYYINPRENHIPKVYLIDLKSTEPATDVNKLRGDGKLVSEVKTTRSNSDTDTVTEPVIRISNDAAESTVDEANPLLVNGEDEKIEKNVDGKIDLSHIINRKYVEKVLRDSINNHHLNNFIKPENETCKRRLPKCIVVGVAKSGTREIMDFMKLHPHIEIYQAASYENPYFGRAYRKGKARFRSKMPCSYSNQITVVKNAWYFHNHFVPERIKAFNESVKLIVIVREPVSRAISQFMFFHKGHGMNNYENALFRGNSINSKSDAVRRSVYDKPMENWLQYFKLDQFLIIESNELKFSPAKVMRKVEDFLGLGHFISPEMFVLNKEKGFYCVQSNLTVNGMACYAANRGRTQPTVRPSVIYKLKEYFRPKNEKFFEIIGKSFDWN